MSFCSKIERTQIYLRGVQELRIVGDVCWWVPGVVIVYRAPEGTHPALSDDDLRAPLPREYNPLFLRGPPWLKSSETCALPLRVYICYNISSPMAYRASYAGEIR
jgi:hypothetical protein